MDREIVKRYLKDRFFAIIMFLVSNLSIIMFFHLSEPSNKEVVYPFILGIFFLTFFLLVDGFRYYQSNKAVSQLLLGQFSELQAITEEQKLFIELLHKNSEAYSKEKNELVETNKERLYFLSHWMHHLKTPVSVIDLHIQNESNDPEKWTGIQKENKRLLKTIEQGLTMIRMDSFENDLAIEKVDIVKSIRAMINQHKSECIHHSVFPVVLSKQPTVHVLTDAKWNNVMLDQLISNAIKYSISKKGNKKMTIEIESTPDDVLLSIHDEGMGIPSYDLERVFSPFFTGENGRKVPNSSGIGLYLCKKIAEKLNHTIHIQSELTNGTTVSIKYLTKL
ncbi:HAMP domain-containing sensor histidine kinase [Bacillus sp. THAF10]|uniref:sensor histidine kinase n=1 Tax=Bacillus sp. THAF10 TaxID=2587848 RepID=UPI001267FFC6|nr:sensor histidine kinase [Bacillus sp. THAF10]